MAIKFLFLILLFTSSVFSQYRRDLFLKNWATYSGCIDTKEQVLIRDAKAALVYSQTNGKNCAIVSSTWVCPWTSKVIVDPGKLEVAHSVPLKWAYDHGAKDWTQAKREQFANSLDVGHLVTVDLAIFKVRGESGPDLWLPEEGKCNYVRNFDNIAKKWQLRYSLAEQKTIGGLIKQYCFP